MTVTRKVLSLGLLAGLLAGTATAQAGETMIFKDGAPKAAELARILWPTKNRAQGVTGATRSIRINPEVVPEAAAAQPVTRSLSLIVKPPKRFCLSAVASSQTSVSDAEL